MEINTPTLGGGEVASWGAVIPVVGGTGGVVAEERVVAALRRQAMLFDVADVPLADRMGGVACAGAAITPSCPFVICTR